MATHSLHPYSLHPFEEVARYRKVAALSATLDRLIAEAREDSVYAVIIDRARNLAAWEVNERLTLALCAGVNPPSEETWALLVELRRFADPGPIVAAKRRCCDEDHGSRSHEEAARLAAGLLVTCPDCGTAMEPDGACPECKPINAPAPRPTPESSQASSLRAGGGTSHPAVPQEHGVRGSAVADRPKAETPAGTAGQIRRRA